MLGFWINYGTNQHISVNSIAQWVVPLALQLAPGVLLGLGMLFICPESPRWLARQDKYEAAEAVLCDLRKLPREHEYIVREMGEIRRQIEERSTMKMSKKDQFMKLFQRGTRNRMAIGLALMFLQSFTGVNIIVCNQHLVYICEYTNNNRTDLLRSPHLRNARNHRYRHQAFLHRLLRYREDSRHVHVHFLRR